LSSLPWLFTFAIFHNAADQDLEGDYYTAALVGALSFVSTGPLAVAALNALSHARKITLIQSIALFAIVSLPTLAFQVMANSVSILPLFIKGGPWTTFNIHREMTAAAIAAAAWYASYFLILYPISRRATRWTTAAAVTVAICSFAIIFVRFIRS
jgi:hypothetical protein